MWLQFNEVQLRKYLDAAIQDFNAVVGIIPAACVLKHKHGYYGYLWMLEQSSKYSVSPEHQPQYGWMKMFHVEHIADNEIYLLLYIPNKKVHALKYVIENDSVRRAEELLGGIRIPYLQLNEPLEEYKTAWRG